MPNLAQLQTNNNALLICSIECCDRACLTEFIAHSFVYCQVFSEPH